MRRLLPLTLFACFLWTPAHSAEDDKERLSNWPQWRGPLFNGTAPQGDPPLKWDEETNIKWKVPLPGRGSSTPAVWGDRVFVLTAEDTDRQAKAEDLPKKDEDFRKRTNAPKTYHQFLVLCLDRRTGKELWRRVASEAVPHEGHHRSHSYGGYSPVTDGRYVYALFGSRGLYCYDMEGGLKWKRDFGRMETRLGWGEGGSPTLHGDALIVNWDHEGQSALYVLDARTGQTRWKKEREEVSSWATPLVVEHKGRTQVIVSATRRIRSYDLANGEVIWECAGMTTNTIPSPVRYGDTVICVSGYRGAMALAISLDARGDVTGTDKVLWKYAQNTPYVPSPLLYGDRLYFTKGNSAILTCLDAKTGKPLIEEERLPGLEGVYASPAAADGRVYIPGQNGATAVLKDGDKLEVLATNRLDDVFDGSPVIVGKQLLLRGHKHLYCIEEK